MKREPVAEIGEDDYRIVRHTHDIELARRLMAEKLTAEADYGTYEPHEVGRPRQVWMRVVNALPGSFAEACGWKFQYVECERGRGAFPAVVFW